MMGKKERRIAPLPRDVSLEDLVPNDHFYRRLKDALVHDQATFSARDRCS